MSENQQAAEQKAFEKGQEAFRANMARDSNPYPPVSPYHDLWEQGWQEEHDVNYLR